MFAAFAVHRAHGEGPNDTAFTALLTFITRQGMPERAVDVWVSWAGEGGCSTGLASREYHLKGSSGGLAVMAFVLQAALTLPRCLVLVTAIPPPPPPTPNLCRARYSSTTWPRTLTSSAHSSQHAQQVGKGGGHYTGKASMSTLQLGVSVHPQNT